MMNKVRECEEIVVDPGTGLSYRFAGTFGFLRMLGMAGRDPSFIFTDLSKGLLPPEEIKNVVKFSIEQINGEDVLDIDREAVAIEFVERAGLQDSSLLARYILINAMNGAIKKKQLREKAEIQGAIFSRSPSLLINIMRVGLLWVALSAPGLIASIAVLYTTF